MVLLAQQRGDDGQIADDADAGQDGDPDEVEEIALVQHVDPRPARGWMLQVQEVVVHRFQILVNPMAPVAGYLLEGHGRSHDTRDIQGKGDEEDHQADVHPDLQDLRIDELLTLLFLGRRFRTHRSCHALVSTSRVFLGIHVLTR